MARNKNKKKESSDAVDESHRRQDEFIPDMFTFMSPEMRNCHIDYLEGLGDSPHPKFPEIIPNESDD